MHPSFVRRDLGTLIPPKIATPNSLVRLLILGHFPANFAHHTLVSFLSCASLKYRLKSLLVFNFSP